MTHRMDHLLEPGRLMAGPLVGALLRERLSLGELAPGQVLGAFRIEHELGRGGMGIVYLATRIDGAFEQQVAIKWLPVGSGRARAVGQFRRERQILAGLRHPRIARILDGGCSSNGHLWFAMEHVDGPPVDHYVVEAGMGLRRRVRLLLPVIEAVQSAHARLLVHRDIKPGNVLVDGDGRAMLVDFGIAAMLSEADVLPAYTDGFASPEQCAGEAPDVTHDVWQLGQLLRTVLAAGPEAHPPPPLPRDLAAVLARATHDRAALRYPHVAALQADLERWLAHRPVAARRPGPWHRLRLLGRAHPWGVTGTLAALLAIVLLSTGFMLRLAHQRDVAETARATAEAVNAFLQDDLLPGADPLQGGSGDISVAELAERALARAEPRLHDLPEVAAQVELGLGRTLANLGHFRSAGRAFELAIGHLSALEGAGDERVLRARLQREQYALDPDRLADYESRLRNLRADILDSLGRKAALLPEVDAQLARAAFLRDDFATCVIRYDAVLPRLKEAGSVVRADAYMNLSLCEARLGRERIALAHARMSRRLAAGALGARHPYTLESGLAVETALVGLGRYDAAVGVLRGLVEALEQRYGPEHPVTLNAMHDLGFALTCDGRADEGAVWLQRAAHRRARVLGPRHPWTAMSESVLGMALIHTRRLEQAAGVLARARRSLGARAASNPYVQAVLLENEADLALARGHAAPALARYDDALAVARTLYPPGHPRLAVLELSRGLALSGSGSTDRGRALVRRSLRKLGTRPDCRAGQRARAHRLLAATDR